MSREHLPDPGHGARAPNCDGILWLTVREAADDVSNNRHHAHVFGGVTIIGSDFGRPPLDRGPRQASSPTDQSP